MTLVRDWRRAFGQGDFPLYGVQLANYVNAAENGHWMRAQEGQGATTALRHTGVAVINDIGNPTDIPTNKQDVGRRLAWLAHGTAASALKMCPVRGCPASCSSAAGAPGGVGAIDPDGHARTVEPMDLRPLRTGELKKRLRGRETQTPEHAGDDRLLLNQRD